MLKMINVSKSVNNQEILKNITLEIKENEVISLLGNDNYKKEIFIKLLSNVYPNNDGIYTINDIDIKDYSRSNIFYIPKDPYFGNVNTTVELVNLYKLFYPHLDDRKVYELLKSYNVVLKVKLKEQSYSNMKILYLLMALYSQADYVFIDDLFSNVTKTCVWDLKEILKYEKSKTCSIVINDPNFTHLNGIANTFIYFNDDGTIMKNNLKKFSTNFLKYKFGLLFDAKEYYFNRHKLYHVNISESKQTVDIIMEASDFKFRALYYDFHPSFVEHLVFKLEDVQHCIRRKGI